jgi:hypothetical protein
MKSLAGVVLGCSLLAGTPATASEPLTITANPIVSMSPATITLNVTVEPDDRNRTLTVVTDSEDFYSASEVTLDGGNAARRQRFTVRNLPPGEYVVQARITRADESERVAETRLVVTGF